MKKLLITTLTVLLAMSVQAKDYTIASPDGKINVLIQSGETLTWSVSKDGAQLIAPSTIALKLTDGTIYGKNAKFRKAKGLCVSETLFPQNFKRSELSL